jgi:hypothetical protein
MFLSSNLPVFPPPNEIGEIVLEIRKDPFHP